MKKNIILSIIFVLSLVPMCFAQYGTAKGIQEVSGIINLTNPIGCFAIILYFSGVWINFKKSNINKYLPYIGMIGIILSELKNLFTWNYPNISYLDGIEFCFQMVFPMFYIGFAVSILLIVVYRFINKIIC